MVFPGQGSQSEGMQADLAEENELVRETYAEASETLGYDLWDLVQTGPADRLNQTEVTQPAMLAAGVAAWRCWKDRGGPDPSFLAGHSLGEYTALTIAGAVAFADAVALVKRRAELMQAAVPAGEGGMAAILGLDDDAILALCEEASSIGIAEAVNFNSPGQVVVAGQTKAVERLVELASENGARRAIMLPVSVPSHSVLMVPAGDALAEFLATTDFSKPELNVLNSVDATPYGDADDIRARLRVQVHSPVQWVKTVEAMLKSGATAIVECGPGRVLNGLSKRIDRSVPSGNIETSAALDKALELAESA